MTFVVAFKGATITTRAVSKWETGYK